MYSDSIINIEITQLGLTKKTIEALRLIYCNPKLAPAVNGAIPRDKFGKKCDCNFNYASVLGIILYSQEYTRPYISFVVNQWTNYAFRPCRLHEEAMQKIGWYLKDTMDKGIIMKLIQSPQIDCYVDTDFTGLWKYEDSTDPTSMKICSRFLLYGYTLPLPLQ